MNLFIDNIFDLKGLGEGGCYSYLLKFGNYTRRHKVNHRNP